MHQRSPGSLHTHLQRVVVSGSPKGIEFNSVKEVLLSVKAVKSMHSLHLWALTLGQALVSVHLAVGNVPQACV